MMWNSKYSFSGHTTMTKHIQAKNLNSNLNTSAQKNDIPGLTKPQLQSFFFSLKDTKILTLDEQEESKETHASH